ncbi:MAG: hydrogenase expression/formation protein HypE [Candidatus Aenigmarchaeota archaeon]|nr:hydrogenase expression/formation protein HypE [Candidatus Aenigmarchaeota archaeon]
MVKITLNEGAGGEAMQKFIKDLVSRIELKKTPDGSGLDKLEDAGILKIGDTNIALTTDTYTVNPIFFPGGDIGKLAFCGTVNDLAVMGAQPLALSLAFVIEDGMEKKDVERIMDSINEQSKLSGIPIITGDTKVVEKGKVDKIIINTAGIGVVKYDVSNYWAKPGNIMIVSGSVGDHGLSLLAKRFGFESKLESDCTCLWNVIKELIKIDGIYSMKDPTRGGLAACLNEIAKKSNVGIYVREENIPVKAEAKVIGETLGVDPLQTACEGRLVLSVDRYSVDKIMKILKKFNQDTSIIGEVKETPKGKVIIETLSGGKRFLESPIGEAYPRIC